MLDRIADLAEHLGADPLTADEFGDDFDQAAVALQALTTILVNREARAKVARWETVVESGRRVQRLRPDNPPTQEEQARLDRNMAEILATRSAPAARVWNPEIAKQATGRTFDSRGEFDRFKRERGYEEISAYDARNGTYVAKNDDAQRKEIEEGVAAALRHLYATGQISGEARGDAPVTAPFVPPTPKERPAPQRAPAPVEDEAPIIEKIPLEQRTPVDTSSLEASLYQRATQRAIQEAQSRSGGM